MLKTRMNLFLKRVQLIPGKFKPVSIVMNITNRLGKFPGKIRDSKVRFMKEEIRNLF